MKQLLNQQINNIEKKEQKMMNREENFLLKSTIVPVTDIIQTKIPERLRTALETAFYKGFQLVFEKGSSYIEKTYNRDKIELEYDINDYAIGKRFNKKYINKLDKQSKQSNFFNYTFSVLEGSILGILGIGLPDIPVFISVIVKSIYEIALSYGYHYDTPQEKAYILLLICTAITNQDQRTKFNNELELLGDRIDNNIEAEIDLDYYMKDTANVLSNTLLTAKFIQGIPLVGVVGGAVNYSIINRTTKYSGLKYKKRYLQKKLKA